MALVDRYRGVIFDYGGVLVAHQTEEESREMAELTGIPAAVFGELYWADRAGYDRGDVSGVDYWREIGRRAGKALAEPTITEVIAIDARSWMHFYPEMYAFARGLRQRGIRTGVLSNMPLELGEAIKADGFGFAGFDHITLSYEVRAAKPEAAIYRHCVEGLGTKYAETLFLDDRAENVSAAGAIGLGAMRFTHPGEMLARLNGAAH